MEFIRHPNAIFAEARCRVRVVVQGEGYLDVLCWGDYTGGFKVSSDAPAFDAYCPSMASSPTEGIGTLRNLKCPDSPDSGGVHQWEVLNDLKLASPGEDNCEFPFWPTLCSSR
eukprot:Selendium_serpulae@DN5808_c0_g1_i1.p1